ncbi:hypothetical protein MNBD_NITROSPINAE02-1196 [hydrothermal vent metagenome]|uniref:Histidine kinase n=1 Tax=hydrothermal vent metagenome TaxID=652676 RepID=A0A3B1CNE5_9ZZZZ
MSADNFYKKLLDNANDLIWAIDMEGSFIYINDNVSDWGYSKEELIGKPLLNILNTKQIGKRHSEMSNFGMRSIFEMEIMDKNGKSHMVAVSSSPLHNDDGRIIGMMGIIHDISELQKLHEKLKDEERLASLGRLSAGVAHEIRNPLSSVKMNLDILRKRMNPVDVDREHFELAQNEVRNLERIVTELIDYAKPIPINLERTELRTIVEGAMRMAKAECNEYGVSFVTEFNGDLPLVPLDKGKIHQALLNVLLNAIHASKKGGRIHIKTEYVKKPTPVARIAVKDYGSGIRPEDLKYIFDPFFTTRKSGTGLGLSVVKNILNNHDGTVTINTRFGEGTEVRLEAPLF